MLYRRWWASSAGWKIKARSFTVASLHGAALDRSDSGTSNCLSLLVLLADETPSYDWIRGDVRRSFLRSRSLIGCPSVIF